MLRCRRLGWAASIASAALATSCFVEIADLEGVASARIDPDAGVAGTSDQDGSAQQSAGGWGGAGGAGGGISPGGASGQSDASAADAASADGPVPCVPKTCAGDDCGTISDGCGQILDCGKCSTPCVPKTCSALGAECGDHSDGCGGTVDCGGCASNESCDDGECECDAESCSSRGWYCGSGSNGCGGSLDCGACSFNTTCVNHSCQPAVGSICGSTASCPYGFVSKAIISCGSTGDCSQSTQKICIRIGISYDLVCGTSCPPGMHSGLGLLYDCSCPGGLFTVCVPD